MTQPNHRLAQVLREADMPKKALARAVNARGAANDEDLNTDHSLVTKWLAGVQPRGSKPRYIAEVLSAQVGRTLTPEDLGFTCDVPAIDRAIRYDPGDDDIAGLLAGVWSADLEGRPEALDAEIQPAAWRESARYLLIGQRRTMTAIPTGSLRVGLSDVAAIRATHDHFAGLDDRYGGGLGRQSLIAFLARDVVPLLSGTCADRTRSILLSTVAESTLLAAWMSYDAGLHGLAQRYFVQALRLAEEAGDRRLAGSVLSAMSHQATFLGYYKDAAELARAAVAAIATDGTATLRAQFHAMEARALARTGDPAACDQAIGDALRYFEQRRPDDDPLWISYFDDIELAAELGHCYRDLNRPAAAVEQLATQPLDKDQPVRSDIFVTMVRADAYAALGELEPACATALHALELGHQLRSARPTAYLREFRTRLRPYRNEPAVRAFLEQVAGDPLWRSSRTASPPA